MFRCAFFLSIFALAQVVAHAQTTSIPNDRTMSRSISADEVTAFQEYFAARRQNKLMQNAVTKVDVKEIALDRSLVTSMDHSFSHTLDNWKATDQKKSGRCWMFAGLNVMRVDAMKTLLLEELELSQNYIMFWDKLEKSNYFLEAIIETADYLDIAPHQIYWSDAFLQEAWKREHHPNSFYDSDSRIYREVGGKLRQVGVLTVRSGYLPLGSKYQLDIATLAYEEQRAPYWV